jgi:hypothetical protein
VAFALILKASMLEILKILPISRVIMYECFAILGFKLYHLVHQCFNISCFNSFTIYYMNALVIKSTVMRKSAKGFNISGWLFFSLVAKSKVPIHTSYLPH